MDWRVGGAWRFWGCGRLRVVVCWGRARLHVGSGGEDRVVLCEGWKRKTAVRGGIDGISLEIVWKGVAGNGGG